MKKLYLILAFLIIGLFIPLTTLAADTTYRFAVETHNAITIGFYVKDIPATANKINLYLSNKSFTEPMSAESLTPYLKKSFTSLPSNRTGVEYPFSYVWDFTTLKSEPGDYYVVVASLNNNSIINHSSITTVTVPGSVTEASTGEGATKANNTTPSPKNSASSKANSTNVSANNPATTCPEGQVPTEFGCMSTFGEYVSKILDWLVPALSAVAVLMLVYAGILYMTSGGSNTENLDTAKNIILAVVIGIGLLFMLEIVVRMLGIAI